MAGSGKGRSRPAASSSPDRSTSPRRTMIAYWLDFNRQVLMHCPHPTGGSRRQSRRRIESAPADLGPDDLSRFVDLRAGSRRQAVDDHHPAVRRRPTGGGRGAAAGRDRCHGPRCGWSGRSASDTRDTLRGVYYGHWSTSSDTNQVASAVITSQFHREGPPPRRSVGQCFAAAGEGTNSVDCRPRCVDHSVRGRADDIGVGHANLLGTGRLSAASSASMGYGGRDNVKECAFASRSRAPRALIAPATLPASQRRATISPKARAGGYRWRLPRPRRPPPRWRGIACWVGHPIHQERRQGLRASAA